MIYRIWDSAVNEMFYPDEKGNHYLIHQNGSVSYKGTWCTPDVVLMRHTEIKDKRGAYIFEGDIVYRDELPGEKFVVEYFPNFCAFKLSQKHKCGDVFLWGLRSNADLRADNIKKIGNIFENGDLLNERN